MQRTHGLRPLDVVIAGLLGAFALALIANSARLLIITPPLSWAFVVAFGVAVALTAALRIPLGRRSGMPVVGLTVTLLVVVQPGVDPLRLLGVWTAASLVVQLVQTRSVPIAFYVTGLGALAADAHLHVFDLLRGPIGEPLALLPATVVFVLVILLVDVLRQRGRWGLDWEVGTSALVPRRVALMIALLWVLGTAVWFLDSVVVPAMAGDPAIEQSPLLLLVVSALVFSVAKRIEVRRVRRRLAGVLDAALELPWGGVSQAEGALVAHARTSIEADRIEVRDEPASGSEIGSVMLVPGGRTRYVVASKRLSPVPFSTEDEQILDALAHMGTDTLGARDDVESLRRYVDRDPLTGLPNQRAFQSALATYNRDRRPFEGIAVLFMDLDDFKDLNDGRGHHVGDKMLRLVGQRLAESTAEGGFAARIGGDEFVLILRGLRSAADARRRAEALVETVSATATVGGDTLAPVVSVGVAFSAHEELDPSTIVIEADRSMLALKRGRGRSGRERASAIDVTSVVADPVREAASRAVRDRTLDVAYQPIVELASNRIWAFEALVRLEDPVVGRIAPPDLIEKVRELDLLDDLTVQVVEKAMAAAESFRDTGVGIECMTVNVDLEQLAPERLGDHLAEMPGRFPGVQLCIELNERTLDTATDDLRRHAQSLRDRGVLIALDDYGALGSSAASVATFPLDIVKLDRALITGLATEVRKRELVRALQSYAVATGVRVIVEGAEDLETIALLRGLGVTDVQGYVFGRPDTRTGAEHRLLTTGSVALHSLD
ncbi:bifunctional diguanylate cyclase/phosphodiesterase [Rathayibacter sp. VKM Ac-2754]|uniref:bifunctional diguanylate cyclase/phosphodiesterase n=1 Tax=Rathayibacter sp. VKM Ac-2754 TaxID=2609251 RepID=UPI00135701E8|nr:bifunctional diguanylate cyclase/phosphodiesterase [Rathayibacter sp. VKM Ac-2754]MWV59242.1 EAL domain-containing protein [Rathayibacter sp. VKM Ac-2754]